MQLMKVEEESALRGVRRVKGKGHNENWHTGGAKVGKTGTGRTTTSCCHSVPRKPSVPHLILPVLLGPHWYLSEAIEVLSDAIQPGGTKPIAEMG